MAKISEAKTTEQILFTRAQVARLIGASVATVVRLERDGRLKPVRLTSRSTGQVYFRRADVLALAEGGNNAE